MELHTLFDDIVITAVHFKAVTTHSVANLTCSSISDVAPFTVHHCWPCVTRQMLWLLLAVHRHYHYLFLSHVC